MDRRDFLRAGVAGAGVTLIGCRGPSVTPASSSPGGVEGFLGKVDHGRHAIAQSTPLADFFAERARRGRIAPREVLARDEELFRTSLDSLFVASTFRELPRDEQLDPRVQHVMMDALPAMDDSVLRVADHLGRLSKDEQKAIGDRLRAEPTLAMDVFEAIDAKAGCAGVAPQQRLQLRNIATQVSWRLQRQPVGLFAEEHVAKVRMLAARQNTELLQALAAGRAEHSVERARPGHTVITVGGTLLGISIVVSAVGIAILSAGSFAGAFVVTAGVLGAIGGLVTLIVGLIIAGAS